ncbi:MAG TPA: pyridoxamine 5'-phosphate oxidase family protein [Dehalococcoidia bacterium]|jgi:hypothetical protein|nr:pyridoxamine 5'-phosphate oxidase family protein [Dehalococcoidia bacterium]
MVGEPSEKILAEASELASREIGGTLATMHSEDGTPYLTYVFFHLRESGEVLFASMGGPQHARNISATPEVSFLIDNREIIPESWDLFSRIVIEGRAEHVPKDDARFGPYLAELQSKDNQAARFIADHGDVYCIHPRRLIFRRGTEPLAQLIEFPVQGD